MNEISYVTCDECDGTGKIYMLTHMAEAVAHAAPMRAAFGKYKLETIYLTMVLRAEERRNPGFDINTVLDIDDKWKGEVLNGIETK